MSADIAQTAVQDACRVERGKSSGRGQSQDLPLSPSPTNASWGSVKTQAEAPGAQGQGPKSAYVWRIDLDKPQTPCRATHRRQRVTSPKSPSTSDGELDSRMRVLPVRIDLNRCGYQPKSDPKSVHILQGINTCFESGQLVAVMGPSGSGKSTLLRLVHGDRRYLRGMTGNILINGTALRGIHEAWRHLCSLVPQDDILFTSFTVRETLMFSASLRLAPHLINAQQRAYIVESVVRDLGLEDCADAVVGKISGGQRRRVSIGLELIVNPSVLLLDEPTSGLDSKTAEDICGLLWLLAKPGRLVICSIHQPSYKIFSGFSKVCFLVKGRLIFSGGSSVVMKYFGNLGYQVPHFENPSDYFMRLMQTEGATLTAAWVKTEAGMIAAKHSNWPTQGRNAATLAAIAESTSDSPVPTVAATAQAPHAESPGKENLSLAVIASKNLRPVSAVGSNELLTLPLHAHLSGEIVLDPTAQWLRSPEAQSRQKQATSWQQYRILLHRMLADSYKDKGKMLSGVVMEGTIGLLIGLVWFDQDIRAGESVFPIMGVFIMLTTIAIFDNCVSVGLKFPVTRALHLREFSNGYYRLLPYYLSTVTSSLILSSTYQLIQAFVVFFLVGLDFTFAKFTIFLTILSLAASLGAFLGFIVGTYTSDLKRTQEVLTPLLMPMIIFSGYMLPLPQIPVYLRPIYYLSFYQYIFSALVINHFAGLEFTNCAKLNIFCLKQGESYLELIGLHASEFRRDFLIIVAYCVVLIGIGYLSLRRVSL